MEDPEPIQGTLETNPHFFISRRLMHAFINQSVFGGSEETSEPRGNPDSRQMRSESQGSNSVYLLWDAFNGDYFLAFNADL